MRQPGPASSNERPGMNTIAFCCYLIFNPVIIGVIAHREPVGTGTHLKKAEIAALGGPDASIRYLVAKAVLRPWWCRFRLHRLRPTGGGSFFQAGPGGFAGCATTVRGLLSLDGPIFRSTISGFARKRSGTTLVPMPRVTMRSRPSSAI